MIMLAAMTGSLYAQPGGLAVTCSLINHVENYRVGQIQETGDSLRVNTACI